MSDTSKTTYERSLWHYVVRPGRHWSRLVGGCICSTPQQYWHLLHDALHPCQCDKVISCIMSIAARHDDRSSQKHAAKHAEAG